MNIKVIKLLRTISKVVLGLVGAGLLLYLGYLGYISYRFPPYKVTVSNITDSSFTVSWVTDTPTRGYVYYKEKDSFLPGPLGWINSGIAYDDRDWAYNQSVCVNEFNEKAELDENFTVVNSENFDCEDIKVKKVGELYTHHVTLKNLDAEKEYYFRVGNGFWMWDIEGANLAKTFRILEEVKEPSPMFGRLIVEDYGGDMDAVVYIRFYNEREEKTSILYSSVTNNEGGWYFDANNTKTESGDMVDILSGEDMVSAIGQFANLELSELESWVYGYYDGAYPDLVIKYTEESDNGDQSLVSKAYALAIIDGEIEGRRIIPTRTGPINTVINTPPVPNTPPPPPPPPPLANNPSESGSGETKENMSSQLEQAQQKAEKLIADAKKEAEAAGTPWAWDSQKLRQQICGVNNCGSHISAAQMLDALKNPNGMKGILGYGAVTAIAGANGIQLGKEFIEDGLGLEFNVGNYNALFFTRRNVSPGSKPLTEEEWNELTDGGEKDVFITPNITYDSNGKKIVEWRSPFTAQGDSVQLISGSGVDDLFNISIKKTAGLYFLDNERFKDLVPEGLLKEYYEKNCTGEEDCNIKIEEIAVNLDPNLLKNFYDGVIAECESVDGCDLSAVTQRVVSVYESFIKGLDSGIEAYSAVDQGGMITPEKAREYIEDIFQESDLEIAFGVGYKSSKGGYYLVAPLGNKIVSPSLRDVGYYETLSELINAVIASTKCDDCSIDQALISNGADKDLASALSFVQERVYSTAGIAYSAKKQGFYLEGTLQDEDGYYRTIEEFLKGMAGKWCENSDQECSEHLSDVLQEYDSAILTSDQEILENMESQKEIIEEALDDLVAHKSKNENMNVLTSLSNFFLTRDIFAENLEANNNFFFIPEYGAYTLELGPYTFEKEVTDGEQIYVFYLEVNGEPGLQLPPEGDTNYGVGYDVVLEGLASEIKYTKTASAETYDLKEGINIVSFDFVPSYNKNNIFYAKDLVEQTANRNIEFIARYDAGRWAEGISCRGDEGCFGTDFPLTPGRGYVIRVSEDTKITIPGYDILDPVPVNYSTGWNLVGVHGYPQAYTAGSLIESINKVDGLTADNVSWWPTSKGRYEGLQVTDGTTYGLDFPISPKNGYFVRISKFNPPSSECKSIIWHPGGNLNGVCGDSKSLF